MYPKRKQEKSRNLCMLKEGKMRYKKEEATPQQVIDLTTFQELPNFEYFA